MRRIIQTSTFLKPLTSHTQTIAFTFSQFSNLNIQKVVEYQFHFRSIFRFNDLHQYVMKEAQDIKKYGKTVLLQFLNQYPMQSFRRSRDQCNTQLRQQKKKSRQQLYLFLDTLEGLNFYQKNLRYSIFRKLILYEGGRYDPIIQQKCLQYEEQLIHIIKTQDLHILELINWLYMLPIDYPVYFCTIAFQKVDKYFQKKEIREFMKSQRSIPLLIKRFIEIEWTTLRKYKNLIYFFCYEATIRQIQVMQDLIINLERIASIKWHTIGERVIPKIIDSMFNFLNQQFDELVKNKILLLKVFFCFNYMPLNYNKPLFDRIHNYLKAIIELPSHCLFLLPYNKLSEGAVTYIQSKVFTVGRQDISLKLIYSIYKPYYKKILTPLMVKESYKNMLEIYKKDRIDSSAYFQNYTSLIFRFMKMANSHHLDFAKMRQIAERMVFFFDTEKFSGLNVFSFAGLGSFIQVCQFFDLKIAHQELMEKIKNITKERKDKNTNQMTCINIIQALHVHIASKFKRTHQFSTILIQTMVNLSKLELKYVIQLIFLIEKSPSSDPKWAKISNQLFSKYITDIQGFSESYIMYEFKTLKLTNYMFLKFIQQKASLQIALDLISSLNLKLITSLKGKLISSIKNYFKSLDYSEFDISKSSINNLTLSFRTLFYFRHEIPQFMEYLAILIIKKVQQKIECDETVQGKSFCSLNIYIMQTLTNTDIKTKTQIIEAVVNIMKNLRKKQGLYMKVFELDFLCSHKKHIMINNDVLDYHFTEALATLKKTDRIQHHKDLYFLMIKLHCREFVELSPYDLRNFIDKSTELVQASVLNLANIKECLGYEIFRCQDEFVLEKMKLYLGNIIKLAFRKEKSKQSYFMYDYFLNLFSKLQQTELVTEICAKLLNQKLYPVEVSNIVPILNKNEIKNKQFINRIANIILLSDSYVTYERMQVLSWIQKILYKITELDFNIKDMKGKFELDVNSKVIQLKEKQKKQLELEERSIEQGFTVQDPQFDKNYKMFIDYAWVCLKQKNVDNATFKFICRYIFMQIDRIRVRIENPIERKQISKIKLFHVLKYLKQSGFFEVDITKVVENPKQEAKRMQKLRKSKLLTKIESHLSFIKLQKCEKLQKKLQKMEGIRFEYQAVVKTKNHNVSHTLEYKIIETEQINKLKKRYYTILTVKKYHITPQIEIIEMQNVNSRQKNEREIRNHEKSEAKFRELETKDKEIDEADLDIDEQMMLEDGQNAEGYSPLQESELSLEMKAPKLFGEKQNQTITPKQKPLFGSTKKDKPVKDKPVQSKPIQTKKTVFVNPVSHAKLKFQTALKLETPNDNLYKDYNGFLKVEKSLIQILTGYECIIYDPEKDIFFE